LNQTTENQSPGNNQLGVSISYRVQHFPKLAGEVSGPCSCTIHHVEHEHYKEYNQNPTKQLQGKQSGSNASGTYSGIGPEIR
jgi:hypothetical protein